MNTQTVFQAGNSIVVAIPKHLARDFKLGVGHQVLVDASSDGEAIMVKPVRKTDKTTKKSRASDVEFQNWLSMVLEEDKKLLDELSRR